MHFLAITALSAQGYSSYKAAKSSIYLHVLAADIALDKQSMESILITNVISRLGEAFMKISNQSTPPNFF